VTTRVALDAMGGDHAPRQAVLGAIDASKAGIGVVLVGHEAQVRAILDEAGADLPIVHAPESIDMDEDPAVAIRQKKNASVTVAARLVADGEVQGMVSAGSTGAALAAAAVVIGRIAGVARPAIATVFPLGSPVVVLDSGANIDVKPSHLGEFGVMGSVLAKIHLGIERPRVGLLNIGEEPGKGRDLERKAHELLSQLPIDFVGNVEAREIGTGSVDVIVTDGFTGNAVLKSSEGTSLAVAALVLEALAVRDDPAFREAAAMVLPELVALRERIDPDSHGGAHLLGVRGTVVIAHGSSSRTAIASALRMAAEAVEGRLPAQIEAGLRD
jgi:glycerol-3-phosphate acyltransferase PlsX